MSKGAKQLIMLLAVLVILAGAYLGMYFYNKSVDEAEKKAAEDAIVDILESDDIAAITLMCEDATLDFELTGGLWQLKGDDTFPIDESKFLTLIDYLKELQAVESFEAVESDEVYGLTGVLMATVYDSEGNATELIVGDSVGEECYIKRTGDDRIHTVDDAIRIYVRRDLYNWAVKDTFPTLDVSAIKEVEVKTEKGTAVLKYDGASSWSVNANGEAKVPNADEKLLLTAVEEAICENMSVDKIYDHNPTEKVLEECGITGSERSFTVNWDTGSESGSYTIVAGGLYTSGGQYYTQTEGSVVINVMDDEPLNAIFDAALAFIG